MATLEFDTFSPYINDLFQVKNHPNGIMDLTLTRAELYKLTPNDGRHHPKETVRRAPFTLFFKSKAQEVMMQALYTFNHEQLGEFVLFLVPIQKDAEGVVYQAVIN